MVIFLEDYSTENRVFSSYEEIPKELINCFLVSEDINFYSHIGIDYRGIARAFYKNILKTFTNKRLEGASTITQQVAKNFLTNEISYTRKIKEIIIALRMEKVLKKEQIMELYLNEIYLGNGSYGIAASLNYFNKSLSSLDLHEMAMLVTLPKAPSTYNPYRNPIKAMKRRNWVLKRLFDEKFIDLETYTSVLNEELELSTSKKILNDNASFFKEEIRREIISKFTESKLYDGGLTIMTTLDEDLQLIAEESFRDGLKSYSFRKGWNGPLMNINNNKKKKTINDIKDPEGIYEDELGLVTKISDDHIEVVTKKKNKIKLFKKQMSIVKKKQVDLKKLFSTGDVIVLSMNENSKLYELSQIPDVNGGMVVIDNLTGRVLAMVGGYDSSSSFNRVTQAKRQLGSSFKPFVYITALENGYTPISKVLDAPFVIDDLSKDGVWRPTNYGDKFYGLSTLRLGIEKSRNLMTIRLSDQIGLEKVSKFSKKLGIYDEFPLLISSSLGSLESSLIKITAGYASIANGGYKVEPRMIDVIYDKKGKIIFNGDKRKCEKCNIKKDNYSSFRQYELPKIKNNSERIFFQRFSLSNDLFSYGCDKKRYCKKY